jgi:cell division protein ZapE
MTRITERYAQLVASGQLRPDPEQAAAAARLDRLQQELESPPPAPGLFGRLLGAKAPRPRAGSTCGVASGAASRC